MGKEQGGLCGSFLWARLDVIYVTSTHILFAILLAFPGCKGVLKNEVYS